MKIKYYSKLFFILFAVILVSCNKDDSESGSSGANVNGNPSAAALNAKSLEIPRIDANSGKIITHYVINGSGKKEVNYTLAWDVEKRHSRWVAFNFTSLNSQTNWNRKNWESTEWGGDPFQSDPQLSADENNVRSDFYGYDRGHLCASADRLDSKNSNEQTFYYSNMSPQEGRFNQQDWVDLEERVQTWGRNNNFRDTLFVVKGGTIADGQIKAYTKGGVPVPKYYFMALLCKYKGTYKSIGFWVEHKSYGGSPDLASWAVSIDELEEKTGIDFFCNLPDKIENVVEQYCVTEAWPGL